jgi:hypothetical protein
MTKKEKEQYLKIENALGIFSFCTNWNVYILDIIPFKEYHKVILKTDYIDSKGNRQIDINQSLIRYNTKHKNGYFLYVNEVISLDNTKKAYGNSTIRWNASWGFIKGLLDR